MLLHPHRVLATFIVSVLASSVYAGELTRLTAQLPNVDAPPQGKTQWIAQSMRLNGLPMTIKAFQTHLSVDDVFAFYERWWSGKELGQTARSQKDEWHILGMHSERYSVTVEARSALGGSEGTIAVSPNLSTVQAATTHFPRPPTTSVVDLQEYDDSGIEAEHIILTSQRDLISEVREFASVLQRQGWQLALDQRSAKIADGHVMEVQKGAGHARLTFQSGREQGATTAITIIWRKS